MATTLVRHGNGGSGRPSSPFAPFKDLLGYDPFTALRAPWAFDYDVTRTERGYEVDVPVPGFAANDIEVSYKDDVLTVLGKNDRRNVSRSFTVPEDVDPEQIEARVKDGMLTLSLGRRAEAQPKRIEIKIQ